MADERRSLSFLVALLVVFAPTEFRPAILPQRRETVSVIVGSPTRRGLPQTFVDDEQVEAYGPKRSIVNREEDDG